MIHTPVLVVGAGPVGLGLALELSWRGVPCMVIEQGDGQIEHPRTGLVAIRTMEFCRRWGIAEEVRRCGFPEDYRLSIVFCTSLAGFLLGREAYPGMRDTPIPAGTPEKRQRCPQWWFDPILRRALARYPEATLRLRCRLDRFEQDASGVTAFATDLERGQPLVIRAGYLVGCDGAASPVRQALGIGMSGNPTLSYSMNILFRAPDLLRRHDKGEAERYILVQPEGGWANITVVDGRETWRMTVLGSPEKLDLARFDPAAALRRAFGRDDVPCEILSVMPWRRSQLVADRWREGRVLLAGDAVHTMSPTGGMGMNTGMQDAVDLGWKLAARLAGWGGEGLLAAYEIERRPVALRNALFSSRNYRAWTGGAPGETLLSPGPDGERLRHSLGEAMREGTRAEWESTGLQIGYRYGDSPLCVPDGATPPPDDESIYLPNACPGARAPHLPLADGRSLLDLFGRGFVLLRFDPAVAADPILAAARERGVPIVLQDLVDPRARGIYGADLVLVRPDGHVAWRADRTPAGGGAAAVGAAAALIDRVSGRLPGPTAGPH